MDKYILSYWQTTLFLVKHHLLGSAQSIPNRLVFSLVFLTTCKKPIFFIQNPKKIIKNCLTLLSGFDIIRYINKNEDIVTCDNH